MLCLSSTKRTHTKMTEFLNIAVEGCCHGELDEIYRAIREQEYRTGRKVDLLVVCGDFECIRDIVDLECLAVPLKYRKLNSFHQYVTGEKEAPVTTLFVGGNHEASNVLQSLYYGGYVAPKIYFMGFAGVVNFRGIRIAGLSGIFNQKHYRMGHFERPPYTEDTLRSVYHMRELEVYRMAHLAQSARPVDIMLSHDWPSQIWEYGNKERLLKIKPYFRDDIVSEKLGNPPLMHLLQSIKPAYWFAAHLHVKFAATVPHFTESAPMIPRPPPPAPRAPAPALATVVPISIAAPIAVSKLSADGNNSSTSEDSNSPRPPLERRSEESANSSNEESELGKRTAPSGRTLSGDGTSNFNSPPQRSVTQFLALDKVLPGREFLQFLQIPVQRSGDDHSSQSPTGELEFDAEWLAVLRRTHHLLQTHRGSVQLPTQISAVTAEEIRSMRATIEQHFGSACIPEVGPMQPVFISGECLPVRGGVNVLADSEDGYSSSASALQDVQYTQECMALRAQHQPQQGASSTGNYYQPQHMQQQPSQYQQHQQGGYGNGGGRGRGGRYGGGGGGGRGRNGGHQQRGGGAEHKMLFNPTSRVTPLGNAQTDRLLQALGVQHIWTVPCEDSGDTPTSSSSDAGSLLASLQADLSAARARVATNESHTDSSGEKSGAEESLSSHVADKLALHSQQQRGVYGEPFPMAPPYSAPFPYAPVGGMGGEPDAYGLRAYYGATAVVAGGSMNSFSAAAATTAVHTGAQGLERSGGAVDPSELDIDGDSSEGVQKESAVEDPNAIDLDF